MEPCATFERPKSIFLDHPVATVTIELSGQDDIELQTGSVLVIDQVGKVGLADDNLTNDSFLGILYGPVKLSSTETVQAVIAVHAFMEKQYLVVADGADKEVIANFLRTVGIHAV